jgi:TPP-dependent pyruvate/acetoin dehydrogenase alpha subunit
MDATAKTIAAEATDFADKSPMPEPEALYENVWAETNAHGRLFFDGQRT